MKNFHSIRQIAFASLSLLLATSDPCIAQNKPAALKEKIETPVTVTQTPETFTLDNGIVRATINKTTGNVTSFVYQNIETLTIGGIWEQKPSEAAKVNGLTQTITIDPATNNGDRGEVSVKGVTFDKVQLGGGVGGGTNCDMEIRYALGRGESGIYTYATFTHPKEYSAFRGFAESRFIFEMNRTFDWLSVDKDRNLLECAPADWGSGIVIHAKEQRILSQGNYKGSVEHKYSYSGVQYRTPAYGWSSTKDHIGLWFINPSTEYLSGGATKCELDCHLGSDSNPVPIILNYWKGSHYGGSVLNVEAGEEWNKVIGPIFVYANVLDDFQTPSQADLDQLKATAGNPTVPQAWKNNANALFDDALAQAKLEKAKWPYEWVNGVDYPKKNERATVSGQLVVNEPIEKLNGLTVGLSIADSVPGYETGGSGGRNFRGTSWVNDAKNYQFWTDGDANGKFTIPNVRAGKYTLHAFASGILGEYSKADITIKPGESVDLGKLDWKPVRHGKQIWEIGVPDRTAREFYKGDSENFWLWGWNLRYALLFPNDITYTIGKSDPSKDWFFELIPHATDLSFVNPEAKDPAHQRFGWMKPESLEKYPQTDTKGPWNVYGKGRATTWTIKFDQSAATKGAATLRLSLAGADGQGVSVGLNGKEIGAIRPSPTNAIRYNTDYGVWQEQKVAFDASLLKAGENQITLTVPAGDVQSGVVWDYLRFEIDENAKAPAATQPATTAPATNREPDTN